MGYAVKCILVKGNQFLLVKHIKDNDDLWIFPGGKLNENESPEDCVKREMLEEMGLVIEKYESIGEMQNIWKERDDLLYLFVCQVTDDKITINKKEIREFAWFPGDKLPPLGPTSTKILKIWEKIKSSN